MVFRSDVSVPMFPFCDSMSHSGVRTRSFRSRVSDAMPQPPEPFISVSLSFARFLLLSNTHAGRVSGRRSERGVRAMSSAWRRGSCRRCFCACACSSSRGRGRRRRGPQRRESPTRRACERAGGVWTRLIFTIFIFRFKFKTFMLCQMTQCYALGTISSSRSR